MTPDPLETALRRLAPAPGPTPEAVAFRAGELAGRRRAWRRFIPAFAALGLLAAVGWVTALATPAPVVQPVAPAAEVAPEPETPPLWQGHYDILAGMDPDALAGPPPAAASAPPPFPMEDDR